MTPVNTQDAQDDSLASGWLPIREVLGWLQQLCLLDATKDMPCAN